MNTRDQKYELAKDEESMNLIKIQNKTIHSLINQLQQKEEVIKQYESPNKLPNQSIKQKSIKQNQTPSHTTYLKENAISTQQSDTMTKTHCRSTDSNRKADSLSNLMQENSILIEKNRTLNLTIQKLNTIISTQNDKIDSLLTQIHNLNLYVTNERNSMNQNTSYSLIENQHYKKQIDNLILQLKQKDEKCNKVIQAQDKLNDTIEKLNTKLNEQTKEMAYYQDENKKMVNDLNDKQKEIQNYKSKVNQYEDLLNSKDSYLQDYMNEIEVIIEKYSGLINKAIEYGNTHIKKRNCHTLNLHSIKDVIIEDYQSNLKAIDNSELKKTLQSMYNNIINMLTNINTQVKEDYIQYEKQIKHSQSSNDKDQNKIKEMITTIDGLEQEVQELQNESHKIKHQNEMSNSYQQKCIESLTKQIQQYDVNLDLVLKEFQKSIRDNLTDYFHQKQENTILCILQDIEYAENTNPLFEIENLFKHIIDLCKKFTNNNLLNENIKCENEMLLNKINTVIEENTQLKQSIHNNEKQFTSEKSELINQCNNYKNCEIQEREMIFIHDIQLLKKAISNYEEENEKMKNAYCLLNNQYNKLEKAYEELKKNQKEYENHLLMQNKEIKQKCKEYENQNIKLETDLEIGNLQLNTLKIALQEQIEQTRETLTNYSTTN